MRRAALPLLALGIAALSFGWQQTVNQLQQNGKTISTNLRVVDGTLMVPVRDVASYLGGSLNVQGGTATISGAGPSSTTDLGGTTAGSTATDQNGTTTATPFLNAAAQPLVIPTVQRPDPVEKTVGLGEDANNGGFGFQVVSVVDTLGKDYRTELDPRHRKIGANLPGDRIVAVRMRVENDTDRTVRPTVPSGLDITLFSEDGVGLPAVAFDTRPVNPIDTDVDLGPVDSLDAPLLAPKGSYEFTALFSVPKGKTPQRIAVGLPPAADDQGGTNVTVRLVPQSS